VAQVNLRDLIPNVIVRGQEMPIVKVTDIIAFIHPVTLAYLRTHFPHDGFTPTPFVETMCRALFMENPELHENRQSTLLVRLLYELFEQIDVHGVHVVSWAEFTSFCVEAGMSSASASALQCAPDVEYTYKSMDKFRHYGNKYAKIDVWEEVGKLCLVEER